MTSTYVDLRFTDARGRQHLVRAGTTDPGGWVVEGSLDGQPFAKHCDSWQSVERTMFWLRRHAHDQEPPRGVWGVIAAAVALVMVLGSAAVARAQVPGVQAPAVGTFTDATREYALLHRRLERTLPRLEVTSNPDTIQRAVEQLGAALRAARPDAKPGDFFTEAMAVELRVRIDDALFAKGFSPADLRASEAADGIDAAMAPLKVNGRFPWLYASAMFPCVLQALPPLPPELQYRIVGNTLVLIDVHADLIVDLLPYALADTER